MEQEADYSKERESIIPEFHDRLEQLFDEYGIDSTKDPHTASQLAGKSEDMTVRVIRTMHNTSLSYENANGENKGIPTFIIKFEPPEEGMIPALAVQDNETLFLSEEMPSPTVDELVFFADTINATTFHARK